MPTMAEVSHTGVRQSRSCRKVGQNRLDSSVLTGIVGSTGECPTSRQRLAPTRDGAKERASQDANSTQRHRTRALRSGYAGESAAPRLGRSRVA